MFTPFYSCVFQVHPENSEWTCYEQSALLDIKYFLGFESTMEKLGMKQYIQNISKGKEIIEFYVDELKKDGIINIPRWIPSGGDQSWLVKYCLSTYFISNFIKIIIIIK